jgi:hypothetical protein
VILLIARPGYAGLSDPNEIVEESRVEDTGTGTSSTWNNVTSGVKSWITDKVETVKSWTKPSKETQPKTETVQMPAAPAPAKPAENRESQVEALTGTMPATPGADRPVKAADIQEVRNLLKTEGVSSVAKPGRKAKGDFKLTKAGVPIFPMEVKKTVKLKNGKTKVVLGPMKKVPHLDVGLEPTISRNDFLLKNYQLPLTDVAEIHALPTPAPVADSQVKAVTGRVVAAAEPAKDLKSTDFGIDKIITKESILKALPKVTTLKAVQEKFYKELSPSEQMMLSALILYAKGDRCHVLLGLFDKLSRDDKFTNEANLHLGTCATRMKLHSLAFQRLSGLIRAENRVYGAEALKLLSQNLQPEYEIQFSKLIRELKDKKLILADVKDEVNYLTAKGAFKEGDYQEARTYAEAVPETSKRYGSAQFLVGVSWYSLGNLNKAIGRLVSLRQWMTAKKINDKNLNSLTAVNLARMRFTQGKFKEALSMYMAIDKDHPVWVQGLIEQGWTQLALDDFSGAIGNMYSLHSPYFKTVYKPESFVVRTIGYLNICQYGDAYRTLSWLESEYRPWSEAITKFVSHKKLASDYYETTRNYLKGKSDTDVDGLPYQVIREMARQREFLNHQAALNEKADETGRYDEVDKQIGDERVRLKSRVAKATARFNDLKGKIKLAEKNKTPMAQTDTFRQQLKVERDLVLGLRHQIDVLDNSRKSYGELKTHMTARLDKERYNLREKAGRDLVDTLLRLKSEMATVLENNEFLRYEVFAGSGENIRYQVAGGKVADANRLPASVKPTKMMNWSFDGEYWEDEIGSYRSSLKNNCPQLGKMEQFFKDKEAAESAEKEQAAVEKGVGQ